MITQTKDSRVYNKILFLPLNPPGGIWGKSGKRFFWISEILSDTQIVSGESICELNKLKNIH